MHSNKLHLKLTEKSNSYFFLVKFNLVVLVLIVRLICVFNLYIDDQILLLDSSIQIAASNMLQFQYYLSKK